MFTLSVKYKYKVTKETKLVVLRQSSQLHEFSYWKNQCRCEKKQASPATQFCPNSYTQEGDGKTLSYLKDHFDEYYILLKKLLNISKVCAICACHTTTKILIVVEHQRFSYLGSWQMGNNCLLISCPDAPLFSSHSSAFFPITDCISEMYQSSAQDHSYPHSVTKRTTLNHPLP